MTSENTEIDLRHGDCLDLMRAMPDNSVDSVVTDPPYGLSFMGKAWDKGVPSCEVWKEALRVLKPGGHLLAFAGTRTQHRMACAIEDAGFEIRDMIAWVYGSGFPKSHNVGKAIEKQAGAEREVVGNTGRDPSRMIKFKEQDGCKRAPTNEDITAPTPEAQQWDGWGTALKPALEPITVARKPLAKGNTVAANVLEHGTGALNVDGCRVGTESTVTVRNGNSGAHGRYGKDDRVFTRENPPGRWPANFCHDGSDEVVDLFPDGHARGNKAPTVAGGGMYGHAKFVENNPSAGDSGSAARYFYCAKASKRDRDEGCEGLEAKNNMRVNAPRENEDAKHSSRGGNHHPTVKPTALMRYLCRLVTPPGGIVLDPFMGSGSTGKAAVLEGFNFIGCELDAEYIEIAKARIGAVV